MRLRRRDLLLGLLAVGVGCTGRPDTAASGNTGVPRPPRGRGEVELWSWFDLPGDDPRSCELSGLAWDPREGVLWAVQDEAPLIVPLKPDRDLRSWSFGEPITVDIGGAVDLEGLVVLPDGFIVCSEEGPRIVEVDRRGRLRREVALPPYLREARKGKSLESLTSSPSGRYLFTATEIALPRDGERATTTSGTSVRILRFSRDPRTGELGQVSEHVYRTDRAPYDDCDLGVAEMCATADDALLVLERGWAPERGNTVRIYGSVLDDRASCLGVEALSPSHPALDKTLRVDLARLTATGLPAPKQPQPSALLDNYEGLALGPLLPDGRPSLIVVSDDNRRRAQVARILVLRL